LNLAILPFRSKRSAGAYRRIWTEAGSPLLVHTAAFRAAIARTLGPRYEVAVAMRYGNPSIAAGLGQLEAKGVDGIVVFPLYPQLASSSTGTTLEEAFRQASARWNVPALTTVPPFFDDPGLIDAFAAVGRPVIEEFLPDRILFSFHGLPERHIRKSDPSGAHCLSSESCCSAIVEANKSCYRAQSFATARSIAAALGLPPDRWSVSFQSRLGRDPWIHPYTDEVIRDLAARGVRRLAVLCPAFVADCLETLEEIALDARDDFRAHGGEDLRLVPALNAHPVWVETAARLVREAVWSSAESPVPAVKAPLTSP
jgi:ferrochelatase